MKNYKYYILLLLAFACFVSITGCEEDINTADLNEPPKIAFSVSEADLIGVNLGDTANYPRVSGTVQADAGLQEVKVELTRGSGVEVVQNVTSFDEVSRIIFVIDALPIYTSDLTAVRVSAVDEQGRTAEKMLTIETYINPEFGPAKGLPGTTVTVTGPAFVEGEIESVGIGEVMAESFTIAEDGSSITFDVPAGAIADNIIINRVGKYPFVSAGKFLVLSEEPKVFSTFNNVVTRGQGVRNDGKVTNFSAGGETFTLMAGTDEAISRKIDFITADSGGNDELDLFSPSHTGWLEGNYFEGPNDEPIIWPVRNETAMMVLPDVGEDFFAAASQEDIEALTLDNPTFRVELPADKVGSVILFQTARGGKGLLLFKAHDPKSDGSKGDEFTFDIKVVQ